MRSSTNPAKSKARGAKRSAGSSSASRSKRSGRTPKGAGSNEEMPFVLKQIGPDFLERGARVVGDRQVGQMLRHAGTIRTQLREGVALQRVTARAELMLSLVTDFQAGTYRRIPYRVVALIVFALSYVAAPVDIVPDVLPIIGEVDDAIVVATCARMVRSELLAYAIWKAEHGKTQAPRRRAVKR